MLWADKGDATRGAEGAGYASFPAFACHDSAPHDPPHDPKPVLISVPHAGRDYPAGLLARSRVSFECLMRLEDRYADHLIEPLIAAGYGAVVARAARALIDLNRDARDVDARAVSGIPRGTPLIVSAKQRGGLGLFPRSLPRVGELWRAPMRWQDAVQAVEQVHQPYHAAVAERLAAIRAIYGEALLLDVHSMPPLEGEKFADVARPDVVIGDRFGASATPRFAEAARSVVMRHGLVAAVNHPYPGSYIAERHGRPASGIHAIQIEISRDLYLDARLDAPGTGMAATRAMLRDLAAALSEELRGGALPIAAE